MIKHNKSIPQLTADMAVDIYGIVDGTTDILRDYTQALPMQDLVVGVIKEERIEQVLTNNPNKIPSSKAVYDALALLPTPMHFMGYWNCVTNTPELADPSPERVGETYLVEGSATRFGIEWTEGDAIIFSNDGDPVRWDINNPSLAGKLDAITTLTAANQAYIKFTNGTQGMLNISGANIPSSIVERDSLGNVQFNAPTIPKHGANKEWSEASFVPLRKGITTYHQAYIKYADGGQGYYDLTTGAVGGSLVRRSDDGFFDVLTPVTGSNPTNKGYVDNGLTGKLDKAINTTTFTQLYGKLANGQQTMPNMTESAAAGTVMYRGANGQSHVGTPTELTHIATKGYADNNFVTKVTATSSYTELYGKQANGNQLMYPTTPNAIGNSIVYRDANGQASVLAPNSPNHIANKTYVDTSKTTIANTIKTIPNGTTDGHTLNVNTGFIIFQAITGTGEVVTQSMANWSGIHDFVYVVGSFRIKLLNGILEITNSASTHIMLVISEFR